MFVVSDVDETIRLNRWILKSRVRVTRALEYGREPQNGEKIARFVPFSNPFFDYPVPHSEIDRVTDQAFPKRSAVRRSKSSVAFHPIQGSVTLWP